MLPMGQWGLVTRGSCWREGWRSDCEAWGQCACVGQTDPPVGLLSVGVLRAHWSCASPVPASATFNCNTLSLCRPLQVTKCQCLDTAAVSWWSLRWAYLPFSEKPMSSQFWNPQPLAHFRLMNDHTRERTSKPVVAFLMETPLHKKLAY